MATIYYTASSLDGFIVDDADSLDWLTSRDVDPDGPFGYEAFAKSVGALVMGSTTYEWIVRNHPGDWMYEQPSWVLTSRPDIVEAGHPVQTFDGDVAELHAEAGGGRGGQGRLGGRRWSRRRAVRGGWPDRRDDRQLRAVLAGDGRRVLPLGRSGGSRRPPSTATSSARAGLRFCRKASAQRRRRARRPRRPATRAARPRRRRRKASRRRPPGRRRSPQREQDTCPGTG